MKENKEVADTNVGDIEEAIERLEYIDRTYSCNNYYSIWDLKCIEILLSDYKRILKENESLQKTYDDCYCKYKHYKQFESISIQKVKDKIRKNEEIIDISNDGDLIHELLQKNKVYEELLESE